jgi:protein neuralized
MTVLRLLVRRWHGALFERDGKGWLPIHHAAASHVTPEAVKYLDELGPTEWTTDGQLPLHCAAANNRSVKVVEYLVGDMQEDWVVDINGMDPMLCAASKNPSVQVVKYLLDIAGPNTFGLPLHCAAERNPSLAVVKYLTERLPGALRQEDEMRKLPLHRAAKSNPSARVAKFLADSSPDALRAVDNEGFLPLHWAAKRNPSVEVVKSLAGAWPRALWVGTAANDLLPVEVARRFGRSNVTAWLEEATATKRPSLTPSTAVASASGASRSGNSNCAICLDAPADHAYFPCRHVCVCRRCAKRNVTSRGTNGGGTAVGACPVCRQASTSCEKMFFS